MGARHRSNGQHPACRNRRRQYSQSSGRRGVRGHRAERQHRHDEFRRPGNEPYGSRRQNLRCTADHPAKPSGRHVLCLHRRFRGHAFADGFNLGVAYPSSSPDVIAVGGTSFTENSAGTPIGETAWSGSGGGTSIFEPQSAAQKSAIGVAAGRRGRPTSLSTPTRTPASTCATRLTSALRRRSRSLAEPVFSSPSWAGMTSIVNQGLIAAGSPVLSGTQALAGLLYSRSPADFNDITSGDNGNYVAGPGYDLVTGLGSPVANKLLPDLATAGVTPSIHSLVYPARRASRRPPALSSPLPS